MNLVQELQQREIPLLYATESTKDPVARIKLFTPWAGWTWYVIEWDGEDICFGLVDGFEAELGYFSLKELSELRGPGGIKIECDLHYKPATVSYLKNKIAGMPSISPDIGRSR